MSDPFFDLCFERLIGHEGGFSDDPKDPGNWTGGRPNVGTLLGTKYGIAANTYPDLDIKNLTLDEAKEIYWRDWWIKAGAEYLTKDMVYQMWQFAVNAGMGNAKRCLQRAVNVADDGAVGPATIAAIQKMDKKDIPLRFIGYVLKHYTSLANFTTYGRGWANRTADALFYAAEDN
jgi:lysozyme family protein